MVVEDFGGTHEIDGDAQIETLFVTRYGQDVNEFWLYHGTQMRPAVAILANGDLACVHYFPHDGHPGFQSVGPAPGSIPAGRTMFASSTPTEKSSMPNSTVVPFSRALAVAKEFATSTKLPRCIGWFEL